MLKLALIESPKICPVSRKLQTSTTPQLSLWRIVFCRFASQKHQVGNLWDCLLYFPCISAVRNAAGSLRLWCSPRAPCQQELPCLVLLCVQSSLPLSGCRAHSCAAPAGGGCRLFCLLESGAQLSLEDYVYQHMHFLTSHDKKLQWSKSQMYLFLKECWCVLNREIST